MLLQKNKSRNKHECKYSEVKDNSVLVEEPVTFNRTLNSFTSGSFLNRSGIRNQQALVLFFEP